MLRLMVRPGEWKPSGPIVRAEEYQALLDAEGLIADAKSEAARIRAEAVAEFERRKAEGYAEGLKIAKEESSKQLVFAAVEAIRGFKSAEAKLVAVVEKSVRKIVGDLPAKERVAGLVRTALAGLATEGKAKVRVAAEDLDAAHSAIQSGLKNAGEFVEVVPDPRLLPQSCIVETAGGIIDAGLEVQLKAIVRALRTAAFGDPDFGEPAK